MTGVDVPLKACQLVLHQPSLREISLIGEKEYFTGLQTLCLSKSMYQGQIPSEISTFQLFISLVNEPSLKEKKEEVLHTLQLLFPLYQISLTPRAILFKQEDRNFFIDEGNFERMQEAIRQVGCVKEPEAAQAKLASSQAQAIADKLAKARTKIAAQKAEKNESLLASYISILTVGLKAMSLREVTELTLYQLYNLVERFMLYTSWDNDVRAALAGAKSDKPIVNWMKNLNENK